MTKVLFLLISGKEAPERANMSIITASRQAKSGRYEDVKVLLYGPMEEYVADLKGEYAEAFMDLVNSKAVDSACVAIAKKYNVDQKLSQMGIQLSPFGERLAKYVNEGYQVISF
ncbi:MAG: DsrE family protein [Candidatus Thermoplasmatota archaeon]|nr:DsrE family protein [Candidatus Thermoplasmatota archaeon]MCL5730499.1 DsrE family protein [Candidatus Thermoplasmatota archaeon]